MITVDGKPADLQYTAKQKAFINVRARYPLIMGGVGSGKTIALCRRALRMSIRHPGNRGLLARYTLGESNDTLLVSFKRAIPAPLYTIDRDNWGWIITVKTGTETPPSQILVRALDDPQKYESLELGWFGISQLNEHSITRQIWETLTSRLRWILPDATAPDYTGFAEANSGSPWVIDLWGPEREHTMRGYEAIEVSMYDNAANLPADYVAAMEEKPAWWKRWFVYPCWEPLAELEGEPVFKDHFRQELHVSTEPLEPEAGWPICRGWDLPGPVATVWFQITRKNRLLVLYEQQGQPGDAIPDLKRQALSSSALLFPGWSFLDLADPAGWTKAATDLKAPADLLRPEIVLSKGETSLQSRLTAAQTWLSKMVQGEPALQIDPRCRLLINALEGGYVWRMAAGRILPEPMKNSSSHIVDAWLHALARVSAQFDPKLRREMRGPAGALIPV